MPNSALTGTWRVVSFERYGKDGAPYQPLGAPPCGYAVFDPTGHAFIQLGKARSGGTPEEVAKSLMCYFGPYSIDGDTVSVTVEASNMPDYVGSVQTRKFTVSGDAMTIGTPGQYQAKLERARLT